MKKNQSHNPLLVNQKTLALAFSVSVTTIVNWDKEGLPSSKQGKQRVYALPACIKWFLAREAAKLSSLSEEQARYTKIRRERQELLLAKEREELMWKSDVVNCVTRIGLHLKAQLEGLPHDLAYRLAAMTDPRLIKILLKEKVSAIQRSFSDMKLPQPSSK